MGSEELEEGQRGQEAGSKTWNMATAREEVGFDASVCVRGGY